MEWVPELVELAPFLGGTFGRGGGPDLVALALYIWRHPPKLGRKLAKLGQRPANCG